jgi:hypothetical protein
MDLPQDLRGGEAVGAASVDPGVARNFIRSSSGSVSSSASWSTRSLNCSQESSRLTNSDGSRSERGSPPPS